MRLVYLGYCAPHLSLLFKWNSFFSLALFYPRIRNGWEKKLTNIEGVGGWGLVHVICVIMTHCVRKLICDSPLSWSYACPSKKILELKGVSDITCADFIFLNQVPHLKKGYKFILARVVFEELKALKDISHLLLIWQAIWSLWNHKTFQQACLDSIELLV